MWDDLRGAFSFLTILPLGYSSARQLGRSFAFYPVVGLFIGVLLAVTAYACTLAGITGDVSAWLILLVWVVITGGLHLDGFGDSCDALLATVTPTKRLEIMKDPRAGSWAVVGLVLLLLGKWVTLQDMSPTLLIVPPLIGRWLMLVVVYAFPYARSSGLGHAMRDGLGYRQLLTASLLALGAMLAIASLTTLAVLWLLPLAFAVAFVGAAWAKRRLGGGLTGDVYGAVCEFTELVCLLGLGLS